MTLLSTLLAAALVAQTAGADKAPADKPAADKATSTDAEKGDVAAALQSEGVRKARYNEIERGFSFRLPIGMLYYVTKVKTADPANTFDKKFDPGLIAGLELGYDITNFLDVGGFVYYGQTPGVPQTPRRDLTTVLGGVIVHVSFVHTDRFYFGLRAGAGYGVQTNLVEKQQTGVGIPAALSAEYFTRLRHFSIALDVGTLIWTTPFAAALTVMPSLRYTL